MTHATSYYDIFQKIHFDQISLEQAWNITTGSSTVMVGVVDSGIDATHPALSNRINTSLSRDFTNPYYPKGIAGGLTDQVRGHGTAVAGVIGANGTGVIGINWNVTLISLKVFPDSGSNDWSYVRNAVDYATSAAIPILNMSVGGFNTDPVLEQYIKNYPGLAVCASGNEGENIGVYSFIPAAYNFSNVIAVGGTKYNSDSPADVSDWGAPAPGSYCPPLASCPGGSNFGDTTVDLFAPGTWITTTKASSNVNPPGYVTGASGTSFATPFVTGVAALMKSQSSYLSAYSIKKIINKTVDKGSNLTPPNSLAAYCKTGGRLNANAAVTFTASSWIPCRNGCLWQEQMCNANVSTNAGPLCSNECYNMAVISCGDPSDGLCLTWYQSCLSYCMTQAYNQCKNQSSSCVSACSN